MPSPGRGIAVWQRGTVVSNNFDGTLDVTIGTTTHTVYYSGTIDTQRVWVLFAGRTGVAFNDAQTPG